jgi:hypothetical protein
MVRLYPMKGPLALTGPTMLHQCYAEFSENVAVTYHDTRGAKWPHTGMRAGDRVLAYEAPSPKHFGEDDVGDYGRLFWDHKIYTDRCPLLPEFRFPSIEERVKYYMATWYDNDGAAEQVSLCSEVNWFQDNTWFHQGNTVHKDQVHFFDGSTIDWETQAPEIYNVENLKLSSGPYIEDALKYLVPKWKRGGEPRFLMHLGDKKARYDLPVIVKTRPSDWLSSDQKRTTDPIIAPLEMHYHFDSLDFVKDNDVAWAMKKDTLVWRGATTGSRTRLVVQYFNAYPIEDVDIGLTTLVQGEENNESTRQFVEPEMSQKEQLSYKYLLSLEGNDVATGLKWQLYSNSVVFMPRPTVVSWAMEDHLIPYYHYIPLANDLSDLEEKIQWARKNDEACQEIARHATEYIEDLWMSDKAKSDNEEILSRLVHRYEYHYGGSLGKCPRPGPKDQNVDEE